MLWLNAIVLAFYINAGAGISSDGTDDIKKNSRTILWLTSYLILDGNLVSDSSNSSKE